MKTVLLKDILLFKRGQTVHHPKYPGGKYKVDQAFIDDAIYSFKALTADGQWFPSILLEHEREGKTHGIIPSIYETKDGISSDWKVPQDVSDKIDAGVYLYRSPTFLVEMVHPHTGEKLKHVIVESSFVAVPHMTNLPPLSTVYQSAMQGIAITHTLTVEDKPMKKKQNTDPNNTPAEPNNDPTNTPADPVPHAEGEGGSIEDRVAKLEEGQNEILSILREMKGGDGEPTANGGEGGDDDDKVEQANNQATIAHLEATVDVMHALSGADPETAKGLARLKVTDEALYKSTLEIHQSQNKAQTGGPQAPIGNSSPGAGKLTEDQAIAEAVSKGHKTWPDQVMYIKQHHPHLSDTINS